ncbi:hypothetical protein [Halochromatium roseum]|uniref:hypothetical protein n=1 Tax=Halochromatium roseum TaxID=391920 RepID=UPI00191306CB|nr:hypothetical protein [Halochromatium roseum]MBK5938053.1 hypothetical protein [Halochromatium roseum]
MPDNKTVPPEETTSLEAAEAALDRLATKLAAPPLATQIRRLLPKIERALEAGASYAQVLETLRECGIEMPMTTFRSTLHRARLKRDRDEEGGRKRRTRIDSSAEATDRSAQDGGEGSQGKKRNPLAIPPRPKTFEWDPTERPQVTFVTKKKPDADQES